MLNQSHGTIKIFAGNASKKLAQAICEHLDLKLGKMEVGRFSDGETSVNIQESVRGCDVFVVQSTNTPVNENLMDLLVILDALKRASAGRITVVCPYFGYARQDRKARANFGKTCCRLVANCRRNTLAHNGRAQQSSSRFLQHSRGQFDGNAHPCKALCKARFQGNPKSHSCQPRRWQCFPKQSNGISLRCATCHHRQAPSPCKRYGSYERYWRHQGQNLLDDRRHGGHSRHTLPRRKSLDGQRRQGSYCLLFPRSFEWACN